MAICEENSLSHYVRMQITRVNVNVIGFVVDFCKGLMLYT
jgi:hypothetical protein